MVRGDAGFGPVINTHSIQCNGLVGTRAKARAACGIDLRATGRLYFCRRNLAGITPEALGRTDIASNRQASPLVSFVFIYLCAGRSK